MLMRVVNIGSVCGSRAIFLVAESKLLLYSGKPCQLESCRQSLEEGELNIESDHISNTLLQSPPSLSQEEKKTI
jgi:hypothetical protein